MKALVLAVALGTLAASSPSYAQEQRCESGDYYEGASCHGDNWTSRDRQMMFRSSDDLGDRTYYYPSQYTSDSDYHQSRDNR